MNGGSDMTHTGACHCGAIRFEIQGPPTAVAWDCNCSICAMKRNTHIIVPAARFKLLAGQADLTEYRFNTHTARHLFCKRCGICAFYKPRSNPGDYAVTLHCIQPGTLKSVVVKHVDGQNWEAAVLGSEIQRQ